VDLSLLEAAVAALAAIVTLVGWLLTAFRRRRAEIQRMERRFARLAKRLTALEKERRKV